jgi:hypothetical protein
MELCSTLHSRRRKTQLRDSQSHCTEDELRQLLSQLSVDAWQQTRPGCRALSPPRTAYTWLQGVIHTSPVLAVETGSENIMRGVRKKQLAKRWGVRFFTGELRAQRCSATAETAAAAVAAARKPNTCRMSENANDRPNHRSSSQLISTASPALQSPLSNEVNSCRSLKRLATTVPITTPRASAG